MRQVGKGGTLDTAKHTASRKENRKVFLASHGLVAAIQLAPGHFPTLPGVGGPWRGCCRFEVQTAGRCIFRGMLLATVRLNRYESATYGVLRVHTPRA